MGPESIKPGVLFEPRAKHRPCGVLDRYEAMGMLVGDALGGYVPLLPARPHRPPASHFHNTSKPDENRMNHDHVR